jgi:hypothetical protein
MARGAISDTEVSQHQKTGFVIVQQMFDQDGTSLLRRGAKKDKEINAYALGC